MRKTKKRNDILTDDDFVRLEEIYMLFASVPRLKILLTLDENGECAAKDLAAAANLSSSATSHQLKDLRQMRIIKARKDGAKSLYSLHDHHVIAIIKSAIDHIKREGCENIGGKNV